MGWVVNATSRPLSLWETTGTHCIGGCAGFRVGLDKRGKPRPHRVSDFNQIWLFSADIHNSPQYQSFTKICPVGAALLHQDTLAEGRTDMTNLKGAFSLFMRERLKCAKRATP
jgi:hypothetical protein